MPTGASALPACTDNSSKPWVQAAGVHVLNQPFKAQGNVATAGGCLSAQYISAWLIARLKDESDAREVMHYFAPVGEKELYVDRAMQHVAAHAIQRHSALAPKTL